MKDGTRHMVGVDEAVLRNIEAARDLAKLTRTSLGPMGMSLLFMLQEIYKQEDLFYTPFI